MRSPGLQGAIGRLVGAACFGIIREVHSGPINRVELARGLATILPRLSPLRE